MTAVTDFSKLLRDLADFDESLTGWDMSGVTSMRAMLSGTRKFNQRLDFDTSSVTDMGSMFYDADSFNQPLLSFDLGSVLDIRFMFAACQLFDQPLSWDVSSVTDASTVFKWSGFNSPLAWDTRSVVTMEGIFDEARSFDQPLGVQLGRRLAGDRRSTRRNSSH